MTLKVTVPNTSSDSLTFGSANTPTAAQVIGIDSGSSNGQLAFNTTASGTSTERMRIDASGNVGIGTSSMTGSGNLYIGGAFSSIYYNNASGSFNVGTTTATNLTLGTNSAVRATIDSSGNFLVGTTSTNFAKSYFVTASSSSPVAGRFNVNYASSQSSAGVVIDKYDNTSTTSQVFMQFTINQGGFGNGQINANGSNAAAFGTYSDRRLKENIVDLEPQLDNICALRPVEFDYIASEGGGHQTGFIAQEMQTVYDDCVGDRGDGMLTITGWSKTEARLVKAIQEQQAIIEQLTNRITALEAK